MKSKLKFLFYLFAVLLISCKQIESQMEPESLSSFEITSFPSKMIYNKGEYFSSQGLAVRAVFSNGEYKDNFPYVLSVADGQRLMETGEQLVSVSVGSLEKSFVIKVNEKVCTSIKITKSPDKLLYIQDDVFDSSGIEVTEFYSDGSEEILSATEYTLNPQDGTVLSEVKKVKVMVSVPGFSDYVDIQVFGVVEDDVDSEQWLYYIIENDEVSITGLAKDCTAKDIVIPEKIGDYPVTKIDNLSSYKYDKVTSSPIVTLSIPSSVKVISDNAMYNIASLEKIYFSEGLEQIGKSAFYSCYALKELYLPKSLMSIEACAFENCIALETVEIPGEDFILKEDAFCSCKSLRKLSVGNMEDICIDDGLSLGKNGAFANTIDMEVTYTGSKNRIGAYFFSKAGVKKIIAKNNTLEVIGLGAFSEATVFFLDVILSGMTTIEADAFRGATINGNQFILPEGVRVIGTGAFSGATINGNQFILPESLLVIGSSAFAFSNTIKEIRIPASVIDIGGSFSCEKIIFACNILNKLSLSFGSGHENEKRCFYFEEGVTTICDYALIADGFWDPETEVYLPSTIEYIGKYAFANEYHMPLMNDDDSWGNVVLLNEKFDFPNLKYCCQDFKPSGAGEAVLYDMDVMRGLYKGNGWNLITVKGTFKECSFSAKKIIVDDSVTNELLNSLEINYWGGAVRIF